MQGGAILNQANKNEDAQFRAKVVGVDQLSTEKAMIANKNGVFILCTPTPGTPNMIKSC